MVDKKTFMDKTPVNVLLVVRWPVGGIRTFLKYVYQNFPDHRFQFSFVGADTEGTQTLRSDLDGLFVRWELFPEDGAEISGCFRAVRRVLNDSKFDLVHAHGFTSAVASIIPARIAGVPVVCTSHDVLNAEQFSGWKGQMKKLLLGLALMGCRNVHSVSFDAQTNLTAAFPMIRKHKSVVIPNGIQSSRFLAAEQKDVRAELGLAKDQIIIGFFGRFMAQKGFSVLVDAVERLKGEGRPLPISVLCVGSGGFIREEKAELQRRGLSDAFHFVPFTPDIASYLKGCSVVVMPSRWEACGLLAMEALTAGVPFVGSDCIGLREVIEGTPAVKVRTGDSKSLADGILEAVKIGPGPFEVFAPLAAKKFDVEHTAKGIQLLYQRVLE